MLSLLPNKPLEEKHGAWSQKCPCCGVETAQNQRGCPPKRMGGQTNPVGNSRSSTTMQTLEIIINAISALNNNNLWQSRRGSHLASNVHCHALLIADNRS